ncbi:tetratricopeptide (TPR) repeat protein [Mucilaginibacter sp. UYNi724]
MKNLALNFLITLLFFSACHEKRHEAPKVDWATYRIAYSWLGKQQDSAFFYFNQVAVKSRDSLQIAMAYSSMGNIQYNAGDFYGSQESFLLSLRFLNENNKSHYTYLAGDYNNLGLVRAELNDHDGAINFYKRNLEFARDTTLIDLTWNNIAYAYQQKKNYAKAITIYRGLLGKEHKKDLNYARALTNLATAQWMADPSFEAIRPLLTALQIRRDSSDQWGQNSSFAHLADYYHETRPDLALAYADTMYTVAKRLESPGDQLQALSKLIDLGPAKATKVYFARFHQLNDSMQTARNAAKNQFALIRYNVEKSKADNLKLQKDNSEKQLQLIWQRIRFYGTLLAFSVIALFAALWYRRRKKQQELDKQNAIVETKQNASKKVHDTLANDTYRIMKTVLHDLVPDKEWLLYYMNDLYIRTRDISYEIVQPSQKDFHLKISDLLKSFGDDDTRIQVVGNKKEFWNRINEAHQFELKYILQELMVNMQKHSNASSVTIKFEPAENHCLVTYFDNGIGIQEGVIPKNGLKNTGNRIKEIGGQITFETSDGKGLLITLTLPAIKKD